MGERTPNLKLYKPSIVPLEIGWGEEVNGNFDKIDELLHGAAQSVYLIAGKVNYVANAVYTNGVWDRLNTGMGAVRLALDPSAQTITVYYTAAGSNPISWTTLQTFSSGGLNAGAKKITNLATPTAASDAVTKAYVDTPTTNRSMNGKKITNLGTPTAASDAATKAYVDGVIAALKLSQIVIDSDLNMGGRTVIAAKGQFAEIDSDITRFGETVFEETVVLPYTVTPSDNVYYTADISQRVASTGYASIAGSIVIGPTVTPISPRLYVDVTKEQAAGWGQLRVHKNGEVIVTTDQFSSNITIAIDLEGLNGGDVLTFTVRTQYHGAGFIFSNFRLAGDVVKYVFDGPTAETVR